MNYILQQTIKPSTQKVLFNNDSNDTTNKYFENKNILLFGYHGILQSKWVRLV